MFKGKNSSPVAVYESSGKVPTVHVPSFAERMAGKALWNGLMIAAIGGIAAALVFGAFYAYREAKVYMAQAKSDSAILEFQEKIRICHVLTGGVVDEKGEPVFEEKTKAKTPNLESYPPPPQLKRK